MALPAKTLISALTMGVNNLPAAEREAAMAELAAFCGASGTAIALQTAAAPGAPAGGGCNIPSRQTQSIQIPGCPTVCDDCTFPAIETDLRLFSWPEIESQMWDTDTKIDRVLSENGFPLNPGESMTLEQNAGRTLTWVPDCVSIASTWSGGDGPQPGFLSYQWASGPRGSLVGQKQFSNAQTGKQYECGDNCNKIKFPTYRGCNNIAIGALSSLRLIVTLDAAATSVLQGLEVTVYHRKMAAKKACCDDCAAGKSCSCG